MDFHITLQTYFLFQKYFILLYLSSKSLCYKILKLQIQYDALPESVSQCKFSNFSNNELKNIKKKFEKTDDYVNVLDFHHFIKNFDANFLRYVSDDIDNINLNVIGPIILQYYLSWYIDAVKNKNINGFNELIRCLILCGKNASNELRDLLILASYHCMCIYLKCSINDSQALNVLCYFEMFLKLNISMSSNFFKILPSIITLAFMKQQKNKDYDPSNLLVLIGIVCEEQKSAITREIASSIVSTILLPLSKQDFSALSLYSHLYDLLSDEENLNIIVLFCSSVVKLIDMESEQFIDIKDYKKSTKYVLPDISSFKVNLNFYDRETFKDGLDLQTEIKFPEVKNIFELFPQNIIEKLSLIIATISKSKFLSSKFLKTMRKYIINLKETEIKASLYYAFLYFCLNLQEYIKAKDINEILLNPPFFSPANNIFDKSDNFNIINSIRSTVMNLLVRNSKEFIVLPLMKWYREPFLFSEICYRIIRQHQFIIFNDMKIQHLCRTLLKVSVYYQQLDYSTNDSKTIEIARRSILVLISRFLMDQEIKYQFFSNEYFISFFLSFLFEPSLSQFVLSNLLSLFTSCKKTISSILINMIQQIIHISLPMFPNEKFVSLINSIYLTFNSILIRDIGYRDIFYNFGTLLFESKLNLTNSEPVQIMIQNIIQFITLIFSPEKISDLQIQFLFDAIQIGFDNHKPQSLLQKVIQLIAGECTGSLSPTFIIQNPNVLKFFIEIVLNDEKLNDVIKFLNELVLFSEKNAIQSHKAEFDLYLIDLIHAQKDKETISNLLNLFHCISSVISSVNVVERFVYLMSPTEMKYLHKYYDLFVQSLNSIFIKSSKIPFSSIPMIYSKGAIEIQGLNGSDFDEEFSFCFWIKSIKNSAQYKSKIIEIFDLKGKSVSIFNTSSNLFIKVIDNQFSSVGKVEFKIPQEEWSFITITFQVKNNCYYIKPFIGCNEYRTLEIEAISFQNNPVTIICGGITKDSEQPDIPSKLGSFGIFSKLSKENITSLWLSGPRVKDIFPTEPKCFVIIEKKDEYIVIDQKAPVETKLLQKRIRAEVNFQSALIELCKIDILIPLFLQFDLPTSENNYFPSLLKTVAELFNNIFSVSPESQEMFYELHGFQIISAILLSKDDKYIDYSLYTQFYKMMSSFINCNYQQDLLNYILLNLDIWMKTDAENHLRILRHWNRSLFPTMLSILASRFQTILYYLRVYYYYNITNEEKDYIQCEKRVRGEIINVKECRQLLSHIALLLANESFTEPDYRCLMSHCLTCSEIIQINDLLVIIKELCQSEPSPLKNFKDNIDIVSFLYLLLSRRNSEMICLSLEIIILFYHKNFLVDPPLHYHIEGFIDQLSPSLITREFFFRIGESVINGFIEMFQILCWVGMNEKIGDNDIVLLFSQIKPEPRFLSSIDSAFWPIVLSIYSKSFDVQYTMFRFLCLCSYSQWKNMYSLINVVSLSLGKNPIKNKNLYLHCIAEIIKNSRNESFVIESMKIFTSLIYSFLFYQEDSITNKALMKLYKNSIYFSEQKEFINNEIDKEIFEYNKNQSVNESLTVYEIKNKIANFKKKECLKYGILIDSDGKWSSAELAEDVICLFDMIPYKVRDKYIPLYLIISSYLLHENPDYIIKAINKIKFQKEDLINNALYFDFFAKHCKTVGYKYSNEKTESEINKGAFNCIQKHLESDYNIDEENAFIILNLKNTICSSSELISSLNYDQDDLVSESQYDMLTRNNDAKTKRIHNYNDFRKLWKHLSINTYSWNEDSFLKESDFKRDYTICVNQFPAKLKRNWQKLEKLNIEEPSLHSLTLENEENIFMRMPCNIIKPNHIKSALFNLHNDCILINFSNEKYKKFCFSDISSILYRTYEDNPNSIEIFMKNGDVSFIQFIKSQSMPILKKIESMHGSGISIQTNSFQQYFRQNSLAPLWIRNKMSNFDYLLHLNRISGRTFADLNQYPIFPWVINFNSKTLDLSNKQNYRNLSDALHNSEISNKEYVTNYLNNKNLSIQELSLEFGEAIPEFYYDFEFLKPESLNHLLNNQIPEFIYTMRKVLESDFISQNLNHWIDCIWGIKQTNKKIPQLFFTFHHFKHLNQNENSLIRSPYVIKIEEEGQYVSNMISLARLERIKELQYKIISIGTNGFMTVKNIDFSNQRRGFHLNSQRNILNLNGFNLSTSTSESSIPSSQNEDFNKIKCTSFKKEFKGFSDINIDVFVKSNLTGQLTNSRIAVISSFDNKLYFLDLDKQKIDPVMSDISEISTSGEYILIIKANSIVEVYHHDFSQLVYHLPSYGDSISCCCINQNYFITVLGTNNGSLVISSFTKGEIVRVINLKSVTPKLITVTNGWGFIVVYATKLCGFEIKHYIYVFSVNGRLIRKRKINFPIISWCNWKSKKGFDYMVISDNNGKLFSFEVFYCNIGDGIYRCKSPILTLTYLDDVSSIIAITKDGRVLFLPHNANNYIS